MALLGPGGDALAHTVRLMGKVREFPISAFMKQERFP